MLAEALAAPSRRHTHAQARPDGYVRRRPEETALHRVVRRVWPRFRERCEEVSGGGLPRFVRSLAYTRRGPRGSSAQVFEETRPGI